MAVAPDGGVLTVGEEELVDGVGGGGEVLQVVGGVVPSAAHVEVPTVEVAGEHHVAVVLMAERVMDGVVAAALLAQVLQGQLVEAAGIGVAADVDGDGLGVGNSQAVLTGGGDGREVDARGLLAGLPGHLGRDGVGAEGVAGLVGEGDVGGGGVFGAEIDGGFDVVGELANAVHARDAAGARGEGHDGGEGLGHDAAEYECPCHVFGGGLRG